MEVTTRPQNLIPTGNGAADETPLHRVVAGAHGAIDKLAGAADNAASRIQPAVERAAGATHYSVDKVADAAAPAVDWLNEQGQRLSAARRRAAEGAVQYVSAQPWKSLGIAALAGALVGWLLTGRRPPSGP